MLDHLEELAGFKPYYTFNTLSDIHTAAKVWYGETGIDACCLAENRLMQGETPHDDHEIEDILDAHTYVAEML